jgi:hypothetical protein
MILNKEIEIGKAKSTVTRLRTERTPQYKNNVEKISTLSEIEPRTPESKTACHCDDFEIQSKAKSL